MAEPLEAIEATGLIRIHPSPGGPVAALRGLDVRADRGEIVAIVGPSGSGKSSLLRLLAGLDRPSAGQLRILERDIGSASDADLDRHRRERVGVVAQQYRRALSPYLSAAAAVDLPLALRGQPKPERRARVQELLGLVGLADRGDAYPHQLSGGEQQRVVFAVALAARPQLLLADEPTGELDAVTGERVLDVLRDAVRAEGVTCVVVTHDPAVERIADRVIYLADGRAVAERQGVGATPERTIDSQGWLAPVPPPPSLPIPSAVRPAVPGDAASLEGASRHYGDATHGALGLPPTTAAFRRGGFHVVTGPSGSGKTTLLRLVTGLDRPTAGRVVTLDQDLGGLDREALARLRAARIGIVDQIRDLVPFLSALENVELGLAIRGRDGPDARDLAMRALARVGLEGHAHRAPDALSSGERLRIAIARAIVAQPELLVLDEPTAALDRAGARAMAELLRGFDGERVTILATTHDPALIEAASDRLDLRTARVSEVA
jgi:ABC-type lipoprotein export system ATPase subunit